MEDLHPLTLAQLKELPNISKQVSVNLRFSKSLLSGEKESPRHSKLIA